MWTNQFQFSTSSKSHLQRACSLILGCIRPMCSRWVLAVIGACGIAAPALGRPVIASSPPEVTRLAIYAPLPEYPDYLRRRHVGGTGVFLVRVQIKSGHVTQVLITQSAGAWALDRAAVTALRRWRFRPGAVPYRKITSLSLSPPQNNDETL